MPRKQTSAKVSSIAGKYVGTDASPFATFADDIASAIRDCGIPLNDRAVLAVTNRIEAALQPIADDLKSLAASCLGQDETPAHNAD